MLHISTTITVHAVWSLYMLFFQNLKVNLYGVDQLLVNNTDSVFLSLSFPSFRGEVGVGKGGGEGRDVASVGIFDYIWHESVYSGPDCLVVEGSPVYVLTKYARR